MNAVVATIEFSPGRLPEIALNGMQPDDFKAAMETFVELVSERKLPGSQDLPSARKVLDDKRIDPKAVMMPTKLPVCAGTWCVEQNANGPLFKKTDIPILACAWTAIKYLAGELKPKAEIMQ